MRITLEGKEAEDYIEWRKRNHELAKENLDLRGEVLSLKKKLKKAAPNISLVCDKYGNLLDVKEG